jgi:hypothetical protein
MKPREPAVDLSLELLLRRRGHHRRMLHVCNLFSPLPPAPDAIEIEIDDRGSIEGEDQIASEISRQVGAHQIVGRLHVTCGTIDVAISAGFRGRRHNALDSIRFGRIVSSQVVFEAKCAVVGSQEPA